MGVSVCIIGKNKQIIYWSIGVKIISIVELSEVGKVIGDLRRILRWEHLSVFKQIISFRNCMK